MTDLHARLAENQRIIEARPLSREDYQNWATRARTEWAAANAALRKVLELHKPVGENWIRGPVCTVCSGSHYGHHTWPCPTVKAIEEAMNDDD